MVTYSGPIVDRWEMSHPGEPFPDPVQHPEMFESMHLTIINNTYQGTPSCSNGMICIYGVLDVDCQIQNSCYINLLKVVGVFLLTLISVVASFYILLFLCKHAPKLKSVLSPLVQSLCCIGGVCGSINCNFYRKRVAKNVKEAQKKQLKEAKQKLKKMNMDVNIDGLSEEKRKQILMMLDQYQLVDEV